MESYPDKKEYRVQNWYVKMGKKRVLPCQGIHHKKRTGGYGKLIRA